MKRQVRYVGVTQGFRDELEARTIVPYSWLEKRSRNPRALVAKMRLQGNPIYTVMWANQIVGYMLPPKEDLR